MFAFSFHAAEIANWTCLGAFFAGFCGLTFALTRRKPRPILTQMQRDAIEDRFVGLSILFITVLGCSFAAGAALARFF